MSRHDLRRVGLLALLIALLGCSFSYRFGPPPATPTPSPTATATATPTATATATSTPTATPSPTPSSTPTVTPIANAQGVRYCEFVPGESAAAVMPPEVLDPPDPTPFPTPDAPLPSTVDGETTTRQLTLYRELWEVVNTYYVHPDFGGRDWAEIGARYEAMIHAGLTQEDFYVAMRLMITDLGDEHSYFQSPDEVAEQEARMSGENDFVGIGAISQGLDDGESAVIISVFPGSPAEQAGVRSHDVMLGVDGGSLYDEDGMPRTLGLVGTPVTVTVQTPGQAPRDLSMTRQRVTGAWPIDTCMVRHTRIGYIFFPTFLDSTIDDQTRTALERMTADGPLDGLILDNRMNGGGLSNVGAAVLGLFTNGTAGYFVSRDDRDELYIRSEDIGGSQTVPLVVMVGRDTGSYGELFSGILSNAERAIIVGETTFGNVEQLRGFALSDGSRVWVAVDTFEPVGLEAGIWEETGIIPDITAPSRWDLFTEATDPGLDVSIRLLTGD